MTYERRRQQNEKGPKAQHSRFLTGVVAAAVVIGALQLAVVETCRDIKGFFLGRQKGPKRF
jgi:heme/copper-type cytochrome/quinol oxidase subunit 2